VVDDAADLESGAAERLLFFSDAVVAIALTLLALELPVPSGTTTWQGIGVIVGFGLSIPVFFATTYGWLLWIAGPVVVGEVSRRRTGRRSRLRL
jgi:uncharacterized membrane protein